MVIDDRNLKEIQEDIKSRMIILGRVIIFRRVTIAFFLFTFIMGVYNIIKWAISDTTINKNCALAILWISLSIILLLLFNALQGFSLSIKQEIFNDKKILSKL